ncbi:MAG: CRISPR-associated endonuclease Cas6 [Cyclobacteriaceae bacterium]
MPLPLTIIRFPDIRLEKRDAHKLRGYFGNLFKAHSPLLHNHFEDGSLRYRYPLVQYKVIDEIPMLVGINDGAKLLTELFLKIKELNIDGNIYPLHQKNLDHLQGEAGLSQTLHTYKFANRWMALNQENYKKYLTLSSADQRQQLLNGILVSNLLSFFKGVDIWLQGQIMATGKFTEHKTSFKNRPMLIFDGDFVANVLLPDLVGVGKQTSRGFGTVRPVRIDPKPIKS